LLNAMFAPSKGEGALESGRKSWLERHRTGVAALVIVSLFAVSAAVLTFSDRHDRKPQPAAQAPPSPNARPREPAPDRSRYRDNELAPEERAQVVEGLIELSDRFSSVSGGGRASDTDPTILMRRFSERVRYLGPVLSEDELAHLHQEPDAAQALSWHEIVSRFVPDRPLPGDFDHGPLVWQLDMLAWSYHLPPDLARRPAEVPHALADALALDSHGRSFSPGASNYPAVNSYALFLARLPRR
jgi:hypothetical protein